MRALETAGAARRSDIARANRLLEAGLTSAAEKVREAIVTRDLTVAKIADIVARSNRYHARKGLRDYGLGMRQIFLLSIIHPTFFDQ